MRNDFTRRQHPRRIISRRQTRRIREDDLRELLQC